MNYRITQFIVGLLLGSTVSGLFVNTTQTKEILEGIQAVTITLTTLFTAYWTSKTFGHQARSAEAKEMMELITQIEGSIIKLSNAELLYSLAGTNPLSGEHENYISSYKNDFYNATQVFINKMSTNSYLAPSAFKMCIMVSVELGNVEKFVDSEEERKKILKELYKVKFEIRKTTYFNFSDEVRRLRKYLRI